MQAMLVFPNQLFVHNRADTVFFFLEDAHFFDMGIPFHKHKIMLHVASMKAHFDQLSGEKHYLKYPFTLDTLKKALQGFNEVIAYDPVDHRIKSHYESLNITWLETPNFLTSDYIITEFFKNRSRYFMHDFYIFQRKRLNILMDHDAPINGRYSFDTENRKTLPKDLSVPKPLEFSKNSYVIEAAKWTNMMFKDNPGTTDTFNHPTTRQEALRQLDSFLEEKFSNFGPYQDALSDQDPFLFHSNLSSSLNIGLLNPNEIISKALEKDVPIESKEGFIRQIIGWREFMRAIYLLEGIQMKSSNVLNHQHKLSKTWYNATTQLPIVDQVIRKLIDHAYSHHIERLMVLGNIMMLSNIHPKDVYTYFMAMHIDAYDWVMVPNIYGMSQFASGNLMTTKPYFSGANYLKKMGVKNGPWSETWDALFYLFLKDHRALIEKNPRLSILIKNLDKKDLKTMNHYTALKNDFLSITVLPN